MPARSGSGGNGTGLPGAQDADSLIFTTPPRTSVKGKVYGDRKPVRHNLFYKRVFRPAIVGKKDKTDPEGERYEIPPALPANKQALRWHDLRHTCASLSLAVAPNLHVVKERLGHEDIRTTVNIYGHLLPSVDAALADGLGAMFDVAASDEAKPSNITPLTGRDGTAR